MQHKHRPNGFCSNPYLGKYDRTISQTESSPRGFFYSVQYGESIFSISQAFSIPMMDIIDANRLLPPYVIYPGQRLFIPYDEQLPPENGGIYIVQTGDTLYSIAQTFNTTVEKIAELNNIDNPDLIYSGQRIIIPSAMNIIIQKVK